MSSDKCGCTESICKVDPGYFYGFVYFRQVSDKTIPRGYFQKVPDPLVKLVSELVMFPIVSPWWC